MSGLLISLVLALATAGGLVAWLRPRRGIAQLIAATALFGLAGYAWQSAPGLAGHPAVVPGADARGADTLFALDRRVWLATVGVDAMQLDGADALIRNGKADYAAGILRAGTMRDPENMMLWLGLGNALQAYAGGAITPAARYAFDRAAQVAPNHPAPAYFLGLAEVQMGDLEGAADVWRSLLAGAPRDAAWRTRVAARLATIEELRKPR